MMPTLRFRQVPASDYVYVLHFYDGARKEVPHLKLQQWWAHPEWFVEHPDGTTSDYGEWRDVPVELKP